MIRDSFHNGEVNATWEACMGADHHWNVSRKLPAYRGSGKSGQGVAGHGRYERREMSLLRWKGRQV
jgi:hypothetical protein